MLIRVGFYNTPFSFVESESVAFCENSNNTNTIVNMLLKYKPSLDTGYYRNNNAIECVCLVQVETLKTCKLRSEDVRMSSNSEMCIKKSWSDDHNYTCRNGVEISSSVDSLKQSFDTAYKIRFIPNNPPPMVWIQVQGMLKIMLNLCSSNI